MHQSLIAALTTTFFAVGIAHAAVDDRVDVDLLANVQYAQNNFTDLVDGYDGVDAYLVVKPTYWFTDKKQAGAYAEIIPVYTTEDVFWFQRYIQLTAGLQYYFLEKKDNETNPWRGLRFFALGATREFYDEETGANPEDSDVQVGLDYYYDNILMKAEQLTFSAFANAGYRQTNFALDDYEAFSWFGNVKVGTKHVVGDAILFPYVVADWTHSPSHDDRWFENFLRVGGGLRCYPMASPMADIKDRDTVQDLKARFHFFVEGIQNVAWLGDDAPDSVDESDLRVGIAFATGGLTRD